MNRNVKRQASLKSPEHRWKQNLNLKIVYRRIEELKPDPANPRRHTKKQIRQIGNSLKAFDFIVPVLIDCDNNIIAGSGRVLAGREVGISEVPTVRLDHLSPEQARAFRIADNRLTRSRPGTISYSRSSLRSSRWLVST